MGASGVGKTQLIRSLTSLVPELVSIVERTHFVEKNRIEVDGKLFEFVEAPGELIRYKIRDSAIKEAVRQKYSLIINVVASGYHEYSEHNANRVFDEEGNIFEEFTETHKEIEIDMLSEWCEQFDRSKSLPNLVTVVSKADIWWDQRENVILHYKDGEYASFLDGFDFDHAVVGYSARVHRMHDAGKLSQYFDDDCKADLRGQLFRTIFSGLGIPPQK